MARKAIIEKTKRLLRKAENCNKLGIPMKRSTRVYHRCELCGRTHGYLSKYGVCRICFRELANKGEIPGVTKSSW